MRKEGGSKRGPSSPALRARQPQCQREHGVSVVRAARELSHWCVRWEHRQSAACAATVLLAGLGSLVLTANGWRERVWSLDMLCYYLGVEDFLFNGNVPVAGTLTSFASFAPPGITWLMLPGPLTIAGSTSVRDHRGVAAPARNAGGRRPTGGHSR